MISDEAVEAAAREQWAWMARMWTPTRRWDELPSTVQAEHRTLARTMLEAAAAVISDEAVEAACVAQYEHERGRDTWVAYEEMPQDFIDRYRTQALLILEAAAPHLLADLAKKADECTTGDMDNYFIDQADVGGWLRSMVNPYRSQS